MVGLGFQCSHGNLLGPVDLFDEILPLTGPERQHKGLQTTYGARDPLNYILAFID